MVKEIWGNGVGGRGGVGIITYVNELQTWSKNYGVTGGGGVGFS